MDVNETSGSFLSETAYSAPDTTQDAFNEPEGEISSLPVIEEDLYVGKREVQTGGVRLKSRIIERPVQESIRLREEYVSIERTPVDHRATEDDFENFKEGTIEVKEYAELPVVSKQARVVEEVSIGKTVEHREEIVSGTVRNTEVEVEDITDEENLRRSGLDL